jgi:Zn-dependent peptidase ImmA (M78 family)
MNDEIAKISEERILEYRKAEISELAEAIALRFYKNSAIEPELIAKEQGITFSYNNYKNSFDGLLEHCSGLFHIYINSNRLRGDNNPRIKFTFAHELGHYFIDEHRNALKSGKTPSHPSFNSLVAKNPVEREADYFASCLLMPEKLFKKQCFRRPFDPTLIEDLAKFFQTSVSSVIFRYFELNLFPMLIIKVVNGLIDWKMPSKDFKYKYLPKKGSAVPPTTAAAEFFNSGKRYSDKQLLWPDDWFKDFNISKGEQLFEKCYYLSDSTVMSVIWKKEKGMR